MKRTLALAFAGLVALSAPAQAARYIQVVLNGPAIVTTNFDMQSTTPGYVEIRSGYNLTYSTLTLDGFYFYTNTASGIWEYAATQFAPLDYSPANFSYTIKPSMMVYGWWDHFYQPANATRYYPAAEIYRPLDSVIIKGSDTPFGPTGVGYVLTSNWFYGVELPESSTWAMLLAGFGAIGAHVRRTVRREKARARA